MKCPFCSCEESKVIDSRSPFDLNSIRRRRECLNCQNRFTTFETIDLTIQVKKKEGTFEDFDQKKLIKGLEAACCHSKISHDQIRNIISNVISYLMKKQIREVTTKELGEIVMSELQKIDMVAYIRFACVYRRFKDIGEVVDAIESAQLTN